MNIWPFNTVSGQGFFKLAQHLVNSTAMIGEFDVREMLPHHTAISRHTDKEALKLKRSLVDSMTEPISKYGCAVTTDIWTANYRKTSFILAIIHYINESYNLVSRVLFCKSIWAKNQQNRWQYLIFVELCFCTRMANKILFGTDRRVNMDASLHGFTRINCSAHLLNVILSSAFATTVMENVWDLSASDRC